ncbi:hypothetical protein MJO28_011635, partial [Puccinia striiformis f. sp. tritici]
RLELVNSSFDRVYLQQSGHDQQDDSLRHVSLCCPHVILDFGDPSTLLKSFIAILVAHDAYTMSTLTVQARHGEVALYCC